MNKSLVDHISVAIPSIVIFGIPYFYRNIVGCDMTSSNGPLCFTF